MRALWIVLLTACTAASPDPGLGALLQVSGAQYRPGPFPRDEGGPAALSVQTTRASVTIGALDETLRGVVDLDARGVVIGIAGVSGTWLLPAGAPQVETPDSASAKATFGVSADFPPGPFTLLLAASDAAGRFGAWTSTELVAEPPVEPTGELVVGLSWWSTADLDLHVVDPLGGEAYSGDPNTVPDPKPGEPVDPTAYLKGGILDHDGNKDCHRDGLPTEHVIWQMPPPDGTYTVRVDAVSMCSDASAAWQVQAYRAGVLVGRARGIATPDDVLQPHGAGAGVLALTFTCNADGCTLP